tara:strand:+ start:29 stop:1150 length:1122 start_codon:yes stop_codon:yes gene_type:complete
MSSLLTSLIKKVVGKSKLKKCSSRVSKNIFSCYRIYLTVVIIGITLISAKPLLGSLSDRDFSFLTAIASQEVSKQELFVSPVKNFTGEFPEKSFLQGNTLVGVATPTTVGETKVLGSVIEEDDQSVLETDSYDLIEYVVQKGDTVSGIADKFNISMSTILWANNLSSKSVLKPGKKLLILPVSGAVHLVQKGDTIGGITRKYKGKVEDVIAFNNLSGEGDIFIGDMLVIPGGKMPSSPVVIATVPVAESYFIVPVEGTISQGLHGALGNAIDISNKCGKPIVAAAGGTVQRTGPARIAGNIITILHPNGITTFYGHLSAITVAPGQAVSAGEIIGYVGNTGYTVGASGCHLHFEVRGASNFMSAYRLGGKVRW